MNWTTLSVWMGGIVIAMAIGLLSGHTERQPRLARVRVRRRHRKTGRVSPY